MSFIHNHCTKDTFRGKVLFFGLFIAFLSVFSFNNQSAQAATQWTTTTIDSTGNVGQYTSIAIASDGFARIAYWDVTNQDLKFVQCTNADCSTNNISTVDSTGNVGQYADLALGSDGFARISYYDQTGGDLEFAQCTNADCSSKTLTTIDSTGNVGRHTSIAMGSDGFARISYYDTTNLDLKFAQCANASCSSKTLTTVDSTGDVGQYTSIAIASDGFARISYADTTNTDLKFAQCTNASCSTKSVNTVDTTAGAAMYTSIAIASDGFARISHTGSGLRFNQCTNASCSTKNTTAVHSGSGIGNYTSIAMGSDDFARISYQENSGDDLEFSQCTNASCSTKNLTTIDSTGDVGQYTSLVLDSDFGRISYYDVTNQDLKFAFESEAASVPDAPTDLSADAQSTTEINLSWNAPVDDGGSAITGYSVERSPDGTTGWTEIATPIGTSYSDTGLSPSTQYWYRVSAVNNVGTGNPSSTASATTDTPSSFEPPTIITSTASSVTDTTATLNGELTSLGDAVSVNVYFEYGIGDFANSTTPEELTGIGEFSFNVSSLDSETEYQFRAVVEYEDGGTQIVNGNTENFTTDATLTEPDAATSLTAVTESSTEISLSWNAPLQDGGSAITGYQIERSDDGIGGWSQIGTTNAVTTVYPDTALTSNTEYFYRVIAVNAVGSSIPSNVDSATTDAEVPTVDTELATSVTDVTATLNASIDLKDYGSVNAYFEYGIGGFISTTTPQGINASGSFTEDITGLSDDSLYQVRAVIEYENGGTQIVYGDTETFTTDETTVPIFPPGSPTGLTATAENTTEISLAWTAPADDGGSAITGYSIERSLTGVDGWSEIVTLSVTNSYSDTGLTSNTEYFYRVSAINSEGTGDPSIVDSATTDAIPPTVGTDPASAVGETTAVLNGTLNLEDYTEADVYFEYGIGDFDESTTPVALSSSGVFDENLSGLTADTLYQFRAVIEYENGGTQIVYGDTETFTTDAVPQPATEPDSPTGLIATAESASHIHLIWTAPVDDGGATITEYRIDRSPNGVGSWTQIGITDGSMREYDDNGLSASTEYFYRVKAVNSEGVSVASNVASAITDAETTTPTPEPEESETEDLRVYNVSSEVGQDWIKITWKTNRKADSRVRYGTNQNIKEEKEETGNREKHSITIRNLNSGTLYYFRVSSEDKDGEYDKSRMYSATTDRYVNTSSGSLATEPLSPTPALPQYEEVRVETNQSEKEEALVDSLTEKPNPVQEVETYAYEKEGQQYISEVKFQIVDENGQPIPHHPVTLHSEPRMSVTDENGIVTFTDVPTGKHHLIFAYQDKEVKKGIKIANIEDVNAPLRSGVVVVSVVKDPIPVWVWVSFAIFSVVTIILLFLLKSRRRPLTSG